VVGPRSGASSGFKVTTRDAMVVEASHEPLGARAPFPRRLRSRTGDRHCTAFGFG